MNCEYSSTCECRSCPMTVLLSSHPWFLLKYHPHYSLTFIGPVSCSIPFQFNHTVTHRLFSLQGHQTSQGRRRHSPCAVCDYVLLLSSSVLSLWHALVSTVVLWAVSPSPGTLQCHMYPMELHNLYVLCHHV